MYNMFEEADRDETLRYISSLGIEWLPAGRNEVSDRRSTNPGQWATYKAWGKLTDTQALGNNKKFSTRGGAEYVLNVKIDALGGDHPNIVGWIQGVKVYGAPDMARSEPAISRWANQITDNQDLTVRWSIHSAPADPKNQEWGKSVYTYQLETNKSSLVPEFLKAVRAGEVREAWQGSAIVIYLDLEEAQREAVRCYLEARTLDKNTIRLSNLDEGVTEEQIKMTVEVNMQRLLDQRNKGEELLQVKLVTVYRKPEWGISSAEVQMNTEDHAKFATTFLASDHTFKTDSNIVADGRLIRVETPNRVVAEKLKALRGTQGVPRPMNNAWKVTPQYINEYSLRGITQDPGTSPLESMGETSTSGRDRPRGTMPPIQDMTQEIRKQVEQQLQASQRKISTIQREVEQNAVELKAHAKDLETHSADVLLLKDLVGRLNNLLVEQMQTITQDFQKRLHRRTTEFKSTFQMIQRMQPKRTKPELSGEEVEDLAAMRTKMKQMQEYTRELMELEKMKDDLYGEAADNITEDIVKESGLYMKDLQQCQSDYAKEYTKITAQGASPRNLGAQFENMGIEADAPGTPPTPQELCETGEHLRAERPPPDTPGDTTNAVEKPCREDQENDESGNPEEDLARPPMTSPVEGGTESVGETRSEGEEGEREGRERRVERIGERGEEQGERNMETDAERSTQQPLHETSTRENTVDPQRSAEVEPMQVDEANKGTMQIPDSADLAIQPDPKRRKPTTPEGGDHVPNQTSSQPPSAEKGEHAEGSDVMNDTPLPPPLDPVATTGEKGKGAETEPFSPTNRRLTRSERARRRSSCEPTPDDEISSESDEDPEDNPVRSRSRSMSPTPRPPGSSPISKGRKGENSKGGKPKR